MVKAHFLFKTQYLSPVFAERAVHGGFTAHHLLNPLHEGVQNEAVITQVGGVDKVNIRMVVRNPFGVLPDAADQHSGKQKIGKHDDALEPKLHHMTQPGFHQWKRDSRINGFSPAEAKTLHQHPGDLGNVGIGVRVGGTTSDNHKHGVGEVNTGCPVQSLLNPSSCRGDHQPVHAEFTAVVDLQSGFSAVRVENGRDVVLGVSGGKQHRRHGKHLDDALLAQPFQTISQDGPCEFQKPIFDRQSRKTLFESVGQPLKLGNRQPVATAMTTDQNSMFGCSRSNDLLGHTCGASVSNLFAAVKQRP